MQDILQGGRKILKNMRLIHLNSTQDRSHFHHDAPCGGSSYFCGGQSVTVPFHGMPAGASATLRLTESPSVSLPEPLSGLFLSEPDMNDWQIAAPRKLLSSFSLLSLAARCLGRSHTCHPRPAQGKHSRLAPGPSLEHGFEPQPCLANLPSRRYAHSTPQVGS